MYKYETISELWKKETFRLESETYYWRKDHKSLEFNINGVRETSVVLTTQTEGHDVERLREVRHSTPFNIWIEQPKGRKSLPSGHDTHQITGFR